VASELWNQVGVNPEALPKPFRKLCERLFPAKEGQSLGEFMGECMDAWEALGNKTHPRAFAKAKAEIVAKEKEQAVHLPELEALPWAKK
jgi:hypothetical protein